MARRRVGWLFPRTYRGWYAIRLGGCAAPWFFSRQQRAIDPALDVLQIEESTLGTGVLLGPLGWLVFYAMHPTVLPSSNRLIGADVLGVTSRALEAKLRPLRARNDPRCSPSDKGQRHCPKLADFDPLVGIINTNEGDVSPIWSVGNTPSNPTGTPSARSARRPKQKCWGRFKMYC